MPALAGPSFSVLHAISVQKMGFPWDFIICFEYLMMCLDIAKMGFDIGDAQKRVRTVGVSFVSSGTRRSASLP